MFINRFAKTETRRMCLLLYKIGQEEKNIEETKCRQMVKIGYTRDFFSDFLSGFFTLEINGFTIPLIQYTCILI